ncbi:MAG: hypothetical protein Kow0099_19870 [Candidatus Abyssubacteria bacterium]
MTIFYDSFESPVGRVFAALDGTHAVAVSLTSHDERDFQSEVSSRFAGTPCRFVRAKIPLISELREYFDGSRKRFSFSADLSRCTAFQRRVLLKTAKIPYGQTRTYGWLARQAGSPGASRAVGQVIARNPVPLIIPCHRVLGSAGELRGFAGGLKAFDLKRALLDIEGIRV